MNRLFAYRFFASVTIPVCPVPTCSKQAGRVALLCVVLTHKRPEFFISEKPQFCLNLYNILE